MSKTTKKKKKKPDLLRPTGVGLSVKLYKYEGTKSNAAQIATALKKVKYAPKSKKHVGAGFAKVSATGKTVQGEIIAGFKVPILTYGTGGRLEPVHYISVSKAQVFVKTGKGTVEVRGSERVARKFRMLMEEHTGAKLTPLNLNSEGVKAIYGEATDIASVMLSGVERGNLTQAEFRGISIKNEAEIGLYTRKYRGEITRFRGTFPYPSGAQHTTTVNADLGSLMVYRSGEGIAEKDLNWIVGLMEDAALNYG
ncbi:MAG: hypothetical protein ACW985_01330 [Candidatus Thorarchaeota archaeon]